MKSARISAIEKELRRIEKKYGYVAPWMLVKEAEPEGHPLHDEFEWDDAIAGNLYREDQARTIIVSVEYQRRPGEVFRLTEAPHYVRDPRRAPDQGYVSLDEAKANAELAEQILRSELARIEGAVQRGRNVAARLNLDREFENLLVLVADIKEMLDA
jgi:hypothetical protein